MRGERGASRDNPEAPNSPHVDRSDPPTLHRRRAGHGAGADRRGVAVGTIQLLGPSKDVGGGSERAAHADIVTALQGKPGVYEKTFVDSLRRQIAEDLDTATPPRAAEAKGDGLGLELMDESRVEVDIEIRAPCSSSTAPRSGSCANCRPSPRRWSARSTSPPSRTRFDRSSTRPRSGTPPAPSFLRRCSAPSSCERRPASPPGCSRTLPLPRRRASSRRGSSPACIAPSCCRPGRLSAGRRPSRRARAP